MNGIKWDGFTRSRRHTAVANIKKKTLTLKSVVLTFRSHHIARFFFLQYISLFQRYITHTSRLTLSLLHSVTLRVCSVPIKLR